VALREGLAQPLSATVRVAVQLADGGLESGNRGGQGTERALVRRQLHDPLEPELRLELAHGALRPVGLDASQGLAKRHASSLRTMAETIERFPLFPLGLVLLPQELVPLHIFEERYKQMIGECLDDEREFGILWLSDDGLKEIGCSARITRVLERFDDGRLNILIEGSEPFRLMRRIEDLPYPAGDIELLGDSNDGDPAAADRARRRYADLVEEVTESRPEDEALDQLDAYGMAATLDVALEAKQQLLELRSERGRLKRLDSLFAEALERIRLAERAAERASGNGSLKG
jgi:Lon protease-like protein